MKKNKIIYWISTGLLSFMMLGGASMYFLQTEMVSEMFASLGYPSYLVYPLASAKILGVVAILSRRSALLKEWAYAGFFFDFVLAAGAHLQVGDGGSAGALVALALLLTSRIFESKVYGATATSASETSQPSGQTAFAH